jgi:hypothetical protein
MNQIQPKRIRIGDWFIVGGFMSACLLGAHEFSKNPKGDHSKTHALEFQKMADGLEDYGTVTFSTPLLPVTPSPQLKLVSPYKNTPIPMPKAGCTNLVSPFSHASRYQQP